VVKFASEGQEESVIQSQIDSKQQVSHAHFINTHYPQRCLNVPPGCIFLIYTLASH